MFTHLLVESSDWPHVRVVNELATTRIQHRESDGPLCPVCYVTLVDPQRKAVEQRFQKIQTSVEQGFPINIEAVEKRLLIVTEVVEQRPPHTSGAVYDELPPLIDKNERIVHPNVSDVVETELLRLEEGTSSYRDSDVPVSSSD